jgi:hypothetical protein
MKSAPFNDNSTPPEPADKANTAQLLAAAQAAAPANPGIPRTADLLGNNSPSRLFDPEAGSNVVVLLDNSMGMMTNGKSFSARQEVVRTLLSMNAAKTFCVLFFHSGGYDAMPSAGPLPATPENVRSMTNWLFSVGHRIGADPTRAVQRALEMAPAPDTLWLLSGSDFSDDVIDSIRQANASVSARINTIGFYTRDGEQALRKIAGENRGAYRFVPPPNLPAP